MSSRTVHVNNSIYCNPSRRARLELHENRVLCARRRSLRRLFYYYYCTRSSAGRFFRTAFRERRKDVVMLYLDTNAIYRI